MIAGSVTILGEPWKIEMHTSKEDEGLTLRCGYCDYSIRTIVVEKRNEKPEPNELQDLRAFERLCLRHEIIHAFLEESGFSTDSLSVEHWARNEEMIDWLAYQHTKIHKAFEEAGAL